MARRKKRWTMLLGGTLCLFMFGPGLTPAPPIVLGIRSGRFSTGCFPVVFPASWPSLRAGSNGNMGFAVLGPEPNADGYFRPVVKEVVEKDLDCGNPRCGFACWQ